MLLKGLEMYIIILNISVMAILIYILVKFPITVIHIA
jgi:hypothetical protein